MLESKSWQAPSSTKKSISFAQGSTLPTVHFSKESFIRTQLKQSVEYYLWVHLWRTAKQLQQRLQGSESQKHLQGSFSQKMFMISCLEQTRARIPVICEHAEKKKFIFNNHNLAVKFSISFNL